VGLGRALSRLCLGPSHTLQTRPSRLTARLPLRELPRLRWKIENDHFGLAPSSRKLRNWTLDQCDCARRVIDVVGPVSPNGLPPTACLGCTFSLSSRLVRGVPAGRVLRRQPAGRQRAYGVALSSNASGSRFGGRQIKTQRVRKTNDFSQPEARRDFPHNDVLISALHALGFPEGRAISTKPMHFEYRPELLGSNCWQRQCAP
jgi:hypothetical protein